MRHTVVALLSCALFSAVLLVNPPAEAYADTVQAAVDQAYTYVGAPYGVGDLVFFDEHGYGVSHVGIATGYRTMIHAQTYYGAVVEAPIDSVPGYVGAVGVFQQQTRGYESESVLFLDGPGPCGLWVRCLPRRPARCRVRGRSRYEIPAS